MDGVMEVMIGRHVHIHVHVHVHIEPRHNHAANDGVDRRRGAATAHLLLLLLLLGVGVASGRYDRRRGGTVRGRDVIIRAHIYAGGSRRGRVDVQYALLTQYGRCGSRRVRILIMYTRARSYRRRICNNRRCRRRCWRIM